MSKFFKKVLVFIISLLSVVMIAGCDINDILNNNTNEYTIEYSVSGGGRIECDYPSGSKVKHGTVVTFSAKASDGEAFLKWVINGEDSLAKATMAINIKDNYVLSAEFTLHENSGNNNNENNNQETNDDFVYDKGTIYAYLPSEWTNVKATVMDFSGGQKIITLKNEKDNLWSFKPADNKLSLYSMSKISFSSDSGYSELFKFDSDYNVFSYTGYNRNRLLSGGFSTRKTDAFKLSILELNDLHGYIVRSDNGKSGLSNASYLINQVREENDLDNVLLVGNGDMFQGTALSNLSQGLTVLKCMNQMQFDFMGIGNHEFDWGLDKIINYFDGDLSNGEAEFPLVNSNIKDRRTNQLISNDKVVPSYMVEKNGIKIGIISMIDNLQTSILYSRVKDYEFLGLKLAKEQAIELKNQGADIILANIHGGDSSGVEIFNMNQELAKLTYNNDWLIDVVVNGHTHTKQDGYITRNGRDLPIVQGGSYCYYVGQVDLYVDTNSKRVLSSNAFTTSTYDVDTNYDRLVERVISTEYELVRSQMEEVYCVSTATVNSRYDYEEWVSNVMIASTGAVCGISNNGGLRSDGDIKNGTQIGLENLYLINPFDNQIVITEIVGSDLYNFLLKNTSVYYGLKGVALSELRNNSNKFKVAVIDYVYYWDSFPKGSNEVFTDVVLRDAMIEDLRLRDTFNVYTDSKAKVGLLVK